MDTRTDSLIQEAVRSAFQGCTVLTIAHRLHTILSCDRILVLDAGQVAEFGPPQQLLQVCPLHRWCLNCSWCLDCSWCLNCSCKPASA